MEKSRGLRLTLLVGWITCHAVSGQEYNDWIVSASALGQNLSIQCSEFPEHPRPTYNDTVSPIPDDASIVGWMLPNLDIVPIDWNDTRRYVELDGATFNITNFETSDIGVYHCVWQFSSGEYYLVKWGVNLRGPLFIDQWDKYMWNTYIGLICAGSFLLMAIFSILVYHFQYIPKGEDEEGEYTLPITAYANHSYDNGTFELYDSIPTKQDHKQPLGGQPSFPMPPPPLNHRELQHEPSWGSDAGSLRRTTPHEEVTTKM